MGTYAQKIGKQSLESQNMWNTTLIMGKPVSIKFKIINHYFKKYILKKFL